MKEIVIETNDQLDIFNRLSEICWVRYHFINPFFEYRTKPESIDTYLHLIYERNLLDHFIKDLIKEIKYRCEKRISSKSDLNLEYVQQMISDVNYLIELSKQYSQESYKVSKNIVDISRVNVKTSQSMIVPELKDKSKKSVKEFLKSLKDFSGQAWIVKKMHSSETKENDLLE